MNRNAKSYFIVEPVQGKQKKGVYPPMYDFPYRLNSFTPKNVAAFARALSRYMNKKTGACFPSDKRLMETMGELEGVVRDDRYFKEAKKAAFEFGIFIFQKKTDVDEFDLPYRWENRFNYTLLQFWGDGSAVGKNARYPSNHPYPDYGRKPGRPSKPLSNTKRKLQATESSFKALISKGMPIEDAIERACLENGMSKSAYEGFRDKVPLLLHEVDLSHPKPSGAFDVAVSDEIEVSE